MILSSASVKPAKLSEELLLPFGNVNGPDPLNVLHVLKKYRTSCNSRQAFGFPRCVQVYNQPRSQGPLLPVPWSGSLSRSREREAEDPGNKVGIQSR